MKSKFFKALGLAGAIVAALVLFGDVQASTLAGKLSTTAAIRYSTAQDAGTASWDYGTSGTFSIDLTDGSTANKANKIHVDTITTATSYDLDAGTLVNPLGVAQAAFSRIVAVRVCAPAANTANVTVGGDFIQTKYVTLSGVVDDVVTVTLAAPPGGCFFFTAPSATGVAVTASTGDVITVTPSGSETAYVTIIGS